MARPSNIEHYHVCFNSEGYVLPSTRVCEAADEHCPGELFAACSDEHGYRARGLRDSGISVGAGQWCVFTKSDRYSRLGERVQNLEGQVTDLKTDVLESACIRVPLVATQALLFAAKDPDKGYTSFRFDKIAHTQAMTNYTRVVYKRKGQTIPANEKAVAAMLDAVINARNALVHYRNEESFYQQVILKTQQLIQRHPRLRQECPVEVLIVETYKELKQCFQF